MSAAESIDTTAIEEERPEQSVALIPVAPTLAVTPQVKASELVERLEVVREAMNTAMQKDVDYGVIPGTGSKPTLLKPGAEKLSVLFQLDVQLVNEKTWGPGDHLTVTSKATVFHAPTGVRVGFGEGLCSTREKKYAYRTAKLVCPDCENESVFKSKHPPRDRPNDPPGWFCWKKEGGCGANFAHNDARITGQERGTVDNPDLPDSWNTVVKMAEKRARIDAVLAVTGASALFTQDVEDDAPAPEPPPPPEPPAPPPEPKAGEDDRQLIASAAAASSLTPVELACLLREVAQLKPMEFADDQKALDHVKRFMDRLPARLVTPIMAAINDRGLQVRLDEVVARGLWDERRRSMELVQHDAKDSSDVPAALASMPAEKKASLRAQLDDILLGAQA